MPEIPTNEECLGFFQRIGEVLKLRSIIGEIREKTQTVKEIFMDIRWGKIPDSVVAALSAAATDLATQAAAGLVGAGSAVAQAALNKLLQPILELILAFPEALFSLIRLPQDAAIRAVDQERKHLLIMLSNINIISRKMRKWFDAPIQNNYRKEMERAKVFAMRAVEDLDIVKYELRQENHHFNKPLFDRAEKNLEMAIQSSSPSINHPAIKRINQERAAFADEYYAKEEKRLKKLHKENIREINEKHLGRIERSDDKIAEHEAQTGRIHKLKDVFNRDYEETTNKKRLKDAGISIGQMTRSESLRILYKETIDKENEMHRTRLQLAKAKAEANSLIDEGVYRRAGATLIDEFGADMELLKDTAAQIAKSVGSAFLYYQSSRVKTNSVYNFKARISNLLYYIIQMLRTSSRPAALGVAFAIERAVGIIQSAIDGYQSSLGEKPDENVGLNMDNTKIVGVLTLGRGKLLSAKLILGGSASDAVVQMINAAGILDDRNRALKILREAIENIPDWEGKNKVWGVTLDAQASPYVGIMSESATFGALALSAMLSGNTDAAMRSTSLMSRSVRNLLTHNRIVRAALTSYTPAMHPSAKKIETMLKSIGMLNTFASSLALKSIVGTIISSAKSISPSIECKRKNTRGSEDVSEADIAEIESDAALSPAPESATDADKANKHHQQGIDYNYIQIETDMAIANLDTDVGMSDPDEIDAIYDDEPIV